MVEVKITYESLFDFLRREKNRNELQQLEPTFYKEVSDYLKEKRATVREEESSTLLFSKSEQEKIKIQIKNIQKILRELYELREKKVINLAMNKVRTESNLIDTSGLLPEEVGLFNDACNLMTKYKEGVLNRVLQMELPLDSLKSELINYPHIHHHQNQQTVKEPNHEQQKESLFDEYKKKLDEAREKSEHATETHTTRASSSEKMSRVKILNDLPKFMGQDKNIYGPFKKDDLAELPESVVNILLKKSRVELI